MELPSSSEKFDSLDPPEQAKLAVKYFPSVHQAIGHWNEEHLWDYLDTQYFMWLLSPAIKQSRLSVGESDKSVIFDRSELSNFIAERLIYKEKGDQNPSLRDAFQYLESIGIRLEDDESEESNSKKISELTDHSKARLFDYIMDSHMYLEDSSYAFAIIKTIAAVNKSVYETYAFMCLCYLYEDLANAGNDIAEMIEWVSKASRDNPPDPILEN